MGRAKDLLIKLRDERKAAVDAIQIDIVQYQTAIDDVRASLVPLQVKLDELKALKAVLKAEQTDAEAEILLQP